MAATGPRLSGEWACCRDRHDERRVDSGGRRNTGAEGGCDGWSTMFGSGFAGEVSVAWSSGRIPSRGPATVLGIDCGGTVELGRGDRGRGVGGGRISLVSGGGRDATIDTRAVVEAALWAVPVVYRTRRRRAVARARAWCAGCQQGCCGNLKFLPVSSSACQRARPEGDKLTVSFRDGRAAARAAHDLRQIPRALTGCLSHSHTDVGERV